MFHFEKSAENVEDFYEFIQLFEKEKKKNNYVKFFGLIPVSRETLGYYYTGDFTSRKLVAEERENFKGEAYGDLTEAVCDLLKGLKKTPTDEQRQNLLKKEIEESQYPKLYAATNFYNLNEKRKQHDFLSEDIYLTFVDFQSFHIGTKKEMEECVEDTFNPRTVRQSINYNEYHVLKKEIEEGENEILLYHYKKGEEVKGDDYEEVAYFYPKRDAYYMKAEGSFLTKMEKRFAFHGQERIGFSRFTEQEFANYIEKKIREKEIENLEELNGTETFQLLLKKYRLRWLFKEN